VFYKRGIGSVLALIRSTRRAEPDGSVTDCNAASMGTRTVCSSFCASGIPGGCSQR
jgi:hypothetical protein